MRVLDIQQDCDSDSILSDYSSVDLIKTLSPGQRLKKRKSLRRVRLSTEVYLKHSWTFWYDEASTLSGSIDEIKKIGTFNTVKGFWQYYNNLVDPSKFPERSNLRLFKEGISPTLGSQSSGGKWTIPCSKSDTGETWIKTILTMIGDQFLESAEICGVILSVRPILDNVILCNRNAQALIDDTTLQIRKLVNSSHIFTYQSHKQFLTRSQLEKIPEPEHESTLRKFVSSCDMLALGEESSTRHKKSSSFSISQFPENSDPAVVWKKHRKTQSDGLEKKMTIRNRKSISLSLVRFSGVNQSSSTNNLSPSTCKSLSPTSSTQPSPVTVPHMMGLFLLIILLISGYVFTP